MPDDSVSPVPPDDSQATDLAPTRATSSGADASLSIGPYRLLQKVGEGGMGEVWLAEQTEPVRRRVGLKIIKQGMDTKQVIARFEAERQALAMMDHPCVAKVFDAGSTPEGRPFFVMEYVRGVPITEHCDQHKLTTRERLAVFAQVCDGVQHAHQKAIIHRDLKPSNVLVSIQDGKSIPKIIDFGVAKATAQRLTDRTLFTEIGVMIGTPEYMSPEQADLTAQDVDTRTDVYSLGVMLYELLVGALPFEPKELRGSGIDGIGRMIREVEPLRPSTRLSTLGVGRSTDSAKHRSVDVPTLRRHLSGDLDWITMKAMEKDRTRRYGSPAELAADISRYIRNEPVLAGPPGTAYRARKYVRRHRFGVALALSLAILVVGFSVRERIQSLRIAREAEATRRVAEFLVGLFKVSDPGEARGKAITAREILRRGADRIETELVGEPEIQARLMHTMGRVYLGLGLYEDAERLLLGAVERRRKLLGEDDADTLRSMNSLAIVYQNLGRHPEAERLFRETLDMSRRALGKDHPDTLDAMHNLGLVYRRSGRLEDGERLLRDALEARRRVLGSDDPATLSSTTGLAGVYFAQGRYADAETLYREVLDTQRRVLGDDHPATLPTMNNLANAYTRQGRYVEAEQLHRKTLEIKRRILGDDHPDVGTSLYNLACLSALQGRRVEALGYLREAIGRGYSDAEEMAGDGDLSSLRGDSEFKTLVAEARARRARK